MDIRNVAGLVLSLAYVLAVLGASSLFSRRGMGAEGTRKLVHIALGGWWVVAALFFSSPWWAAALPAAFVVVNALAYRKQTLAFMARGEGEETPGTVYYAVSLTLLALFSFGIGAPYVGALGVFCMAFGDGFAAVLGKRFGRRALPGTGGGKSLVGTAVMFAASFASCAAVLTAAGATGWEGAAPSFATAIGGADVSANAPGLTAGLVGAIVLVALGLATAAAFLEAASPAGLDNLSVPLGATGLYAVLFLPATGYTPLLAGMLLSGAVALAALRLRLLTVPGALGAVAVGALAFAFGGWPLWLLLMWFFGSSNVASKLMRRVRGVRESEKSGGPRRLRQVLANSVPFLVCALAYAATGEAWFLVVSAGALAASTADTWASEVGVHSKKPPVNIVTRKPMQRGLSGGVSPLGLGATVVGAATSAFLATFLFHAFGFAVPAGPEAFLLIVACGVAGSVVDSFLGALLQAKYRVSGADAVEGSAATGFSLPGGLAMAGTAALAGVDETLVEAAPARSASSYTLVSGYAWITNDAVNLLSGIAVVALGLLVTL
ncbi:DUF92 domain-containing protein [Gordonibacter sp. 28C]|uniref:DUF92 domain-containing protein n=1 Tax=Gordonibacter sp. 28C TaxID=2078569 RepID=UPI001F542181|nr:DUF92 domain-containing protein [Gordonibacter sp. 28C]